MESLGKMVIDQVGSYLSLDEKMKTLKRKCETLHSREVDVREELISEESSYGKKRRKAVENWLTNVGNIRNEVDEALRRSGVRERVKLARQVDNLTREIDELQEQGKFPEGLTLNAQHSRGVELLTKPLVGQAFQQNLEKVWGYLTRPEVLTIGIWGMGGVGKTTLVTHINNRALQQHGLFEVVCWITVSQNLGILKLQDEFAKAVHFSFTEQDVRRRAFMLSSELKQRRCLFILDDVWDAIDLDRVGVPVQVNGCKLIVTTRSHEVCRRMECQQIVKVKPLSEEEAWDLFEKNLGNGVTLSPEVSKVAKWVARECAGLPLGILTVARCMRGVDAVYEWRDALRALKESKVGLVEMEEEVFQVLKFSYSRLKDPKVQQSFLCCALYPEDHKIKREELIQYLIDEGVVERMGSRQAQFDRGRAILNKLVNSCLLEAAMLDGEKCVKMHDLLRDMAIKMTNPQFMVMAGMHLYEIPNQQEWSEDVERVSLMHNYMRVAVATDSLPMFPKLATLFLSGNWSLKKIGNSFFQHMSALQILDLTDCEQIEELPDSVSNLKNLTVLVLHKCEMLHSLPSLAKLKSLKRLDLHGTAITEVPHGLEKLVNLTYLDLDGTEKLGVFPSGILPQLILLEFLSFSTCDRKIK